MIFSTFATKEIIMNYNNNKIEKIRKELESSTSDNIVKIIKELRKEEPFPGIILLLADFHSRTDSTDVSKEIEKFFNDIKDQTLAPEIIISIDQSESDQTRCALISACWQSGLDYGDYIEQFVDYSIKGDYLTALESFTVIEQFIMGADNNLKEKLTETINRSLEQQPDEKTGLLKEIKKSS